MACRWQIRHKLMLGLGLVVSIIALLLAGTLKGLLSSSSTMKSIDSKVAEHVKAKELVDRVTQLTTVDRGVRNRDEPEILRRKTREAEDALVEYQRQLEETLKRRRDPEQGMEEMGFIEALRERFARLREAVNSVEPEEGDRTIFLIDKKEIKDAIGDLLITSNHLHEVIYNRINGLIHASKAYYRDTVIIVVSTSLCGVVLMAGMLSFFYRWVFYPVRDLRAGAERISQGDFDHRIDVHSGDEMEDLARAFNKMTEKLHAIYRDLAQQVNERSRQLVRSERLASVGFLAAGVAHEINNPLASIAFCGEALEQRLADWPARSKEDVEVAAKYLRMIQQEAFRCKAITQRLLEFSRGGERRREATDLAEVIQSVLDVVQHLQTSKGKQIKFAGNERVVAAVNSQEIKSVVLNLVVNALDSMDERGQLKIDLSQDEGMAVIEFADTGCGMTAEVLENIFEPFFTRSRTGKGTGLGLSISHRIIAQHGGEIEARSSGPGQGSTFTVRLPLEPVQNQEPPTVLSFPQPEPRQLAA